MLNPLTPRKTPSRVTVAATRKLPRRILLAVALGYILFGLFFRDAWKAGDAAGLATMFSLIQGQSTTALAPYIGDYALVEQGPLLTWLGAAFIHLFSPLLSLWLSPLEAQINAARLGTIAYFGLILFGLWYSTYLLARRPECQPLPLPFGGHPKPERYGGMVADCAFLFFISCFGIVLPLHETSNIPLSMACHALAFLGLVRLLDRPGQGFIILSLGLSGIYLSSTLVGLIPWCVTLFLLLFTRFYLRPQRLALMAALLVSLALFGLWLVLLNHHDPHWLSGWWHYQRSLFAQPGSNLADSLGDLMWFLLPLWPFALYGVWQWRHWLSAPHIVLPLSLLIGLALLLTLHGEAFEAEYAPLVIPMTILAAMSVPTLRRPHINALDWYAIMMVTLTMVMIWIAWFALYFEWPQSLHYNIIRLIEGFDDRHIPWGAFSAGVAISLLWLVAIHWRLRLKPEALWRGITLFALGFSSAWLLIVTLWLPAVNHNRSYQQLGLDLARAVDELQLAPTACIDSYQLALGQRALFYIYGGTSLGARDTVTEPTPSKATQGLHKATACDWLLVQTTTKRLSDSSPHGLPSSLADRHPRRYWEGSRPTDRHGEQFLLLGPAKP